MGSIHFINHQLILNILQQRVGINKKGTVHFVIHNHMNTQVTVGKFHLADCFSIIW